MHERHALRVHPKSALYVLCMSADPWRNQYELSTMASEIFSEAICCRFYLLISAIGRTAIVKVSHIRPRSVGNEKQSQKLCKVIPSTVLSKSLEASQKLFTQSFVTKEVNSTNAMPNLIRSLQSFFT